MTFAIAALSRQGGRNYNEDAHGEWRDARFLLGVVADGAGGHGGGDVASAVVRQSVLDAFSASPSLDADRLQQLLQNANTAVVARQAEGGALSDMRSTAVIMAIDSESRLMRWAHSGDSRAYLFRGGAPVARTSDHSLVQQMVDSGLLSDEQARLHPQRNMLLAALGSVREPPEITVSDVMKLIPGDAVLLCTDGVWESLGDALLIDSLEGASDADEWLAQIDAGVRAQAKPGQDNYTALAVWLSSGDGAQSADETTLLVPVRPA